MIKGITVTLINKTEIGEDDFGRPIWQETQEEVENVLVMPATSDDLVNALNLYGKKAVYTLGIPKGDNHQWENAKVKFFGDTWSVFNKPIMGIEANIPGAWNKKVMVECYE